ncbi:NAD(P)-dependent alcohol dehydrogenase [Roseisolibacter agri]
MRAAVYCDYGPPRVVRIAQVEKPVAGDGQIVVRVRAAAVNPLDWHYIRGTPYIGRLEMGLRRPKVTRLGVDFAGTVESVGPHVTRFKVGDEVYGGRTGAFAQYVAVRADRAVVPKPARLSFEQAAAIPIAAVTALQALRDQGAVRPGQRVLINGASGGVGTFAVQIAKSLGAHVTGVCSARNVAMVRSIGADSVIDYTKDDFTRGAQRYDVIIDNVGNHSLSALRRVLTPTGRYVIVGGPSGRWLDPLPRAFAAKATSWFVKQDLRFFISEFNQRDLTLLRDLAQAGRVTPVIDRTYPLDQLQAAVAYLETGRARGKVVVTID